MGGSRSQIPSGDLLEREATTQNSDINNITKTTSASAVPTSQPPRRLAGRGTESRTTPKQCKGLEEISASLRVKEFPAKECARV